VLLVAGAVLAVLLVFAGRYGLNRDELYFVDAGHHLQWAYPDQPVVTPLLARLAAGVAPGSVAALHVVSAVAVSLVVVLSALTARELGGERAAQVLTAVVMATSCGVAIFGHMLSTVSTDTLFWTAICYVAVRTFQRDRPRGWLVVGALAGLALENKILVLFLLAALVVGTVLTPSVRHHLRSPWALTGAGIAFVLWLPYLVWQAVHGWPQLSIAGNIGDQHLTWMGRLSFVGLVLVLVSPLAAPLWGYGFARLWRSPALGRVRPLAWAAVLLFALFFVTGGKGYYVLGVLPTLVAAGACGLASVWGGRRLVAAGTVLALGGLALWPAGVPVLSAHAFGQSVYRHVNASQGEMIGWPELVATVDDVAEDSHAAIVVTRNYGEVGALDWYGSPVPVYSGHNAYGEWGPPVGAAGPVVVVGYKKPPDWAHDCYTATFVENDAGVDNGENGLPVQVCAGPRGTWADVWPQIEHLDA
jgi:4-amino-4-deoxy-L-arabinose transferase-like glycosyltransferase